MARRKKAEHLQIPLMFAFRDAFREGDARKKLDNRVAGERVLSERGAKRRGADEQILRENLALDLMSLVNTIDLASAEDIDDLDYVSRSVLNFGLYDISHLTSEEIGVKEIGQNLLAALLQHEPRLNPDTLTIERDEAFDDVNQRMRFNVSGEMACRPFDVPIEFVAEVDVGSGKIQLTRLPLPS